MKSSVLQILCESLDQGAAQFLRGNFCPELCVVVFRVVIAPHIVVFPADRHLQSLEKRIQSYGVGEVDLMNFEQRLGHDPELQLPEPKPMMSAKTYREKLGLPVIEKLKKIIKELLVRYSRAMDKFIKLAQQNSELYKDNQFLEEENKHLWEENGILRNQNKDYSLLRKAFGKSQIETWLRQAKEVQQIKKERSRMHGWER